MRVPLNCSRPRRMWEANKYRPTQEPRAKGQKGCSGLCIFDKHPPNCDRDTVVLGQCDHIVLGTGARAQNTT